MSERASVLSLQDARMQKRFLTAVHEATIREPFRLASICDVARETQLPDEQAAELADALHQKQSVLRVRLSSNTDGLRVTMTRKGMQALQVDRPAGTLLRA